MYRKIIVPVDMRHKDQMAHALSVAADLGTHYGGEVHLSASREQAPPRLPARPRISPPS